MTRLLLAVTLLLPALSRAEQDDAYGSLVGMASVAAADKGPDAGEPPKGEPARETSAAKPEETEPGEREVQIASEPAPNKTPSATATAPAPAPAPGRESKDDSGRAVTVPAPQPPRIWTRLFASLLPPATRAAAFEIEASTAAPRALPEPRRPSTPASVAGSEQGLLEFVSATTAPPAAEVVER